MKVYFIKTDEIERVECDTAEELVREMWRSARILERTKEEYMIATAARIEIVRGVSIRTDSYDDFVADLTNHGFIFS